MATIREVWIAFVTFVAFAMIAGRSIVVILGFIAGCIESTYFFFFTCFICAYFPIKHHRKLVWYAPQGKIIGGEMELALINNKRISAWVE